MTLSITAQATTSDRTTKVKRFVSFLEGQVTFFISRLVSAMNPFRPRLNFGVAMDEGGFGLSC